MQVTHPALQQHERLLGPFAARDAALQRGILDGPRAKRALWMVSSSTRNSPMFRAALSVLGQFRASFGAVRPSRHCARPTLYLPRSSGLSSAAKASTF